MTSDRMVINRTRPAIGQDAARRRPTSWFSTDRTRLGDVHCRRRPGIPPAAGAVPPRRESDGFGPLRTASTPAARGVLTARLCRANGY